MTFDYAAARNIMVDSQVRPNDVTDLALQHAMRTVAREAVAPADKAHLAYADCEIEYAPGRWLMRPRDVSKLIHLARPKAGERALAIAAPYAAAVLEAMGLKVTRLEEGDLKAAPSGPFDVIVSEGAVAEPPASWLGALAVGGRLAVVVRKGPAGRARLYLRSAQETGYREVFEATPPVLPGLEAAAGFVF
ncbi:protein-L-isoaspartate O-methyltransferase family protein [Phenylobacterium montanum]|uniref:Protein-L-isoaspartate O-methyltransferase n=1 Tax=Phenylobacterium montanum TaxID=2823693 RepID=A0A975G173_9CAUL|nr:protein-L-isoaspartate O-methyltransferase [Caulobacter sp. S6]QUD88602.1 protein-L-isoaspartate O-methyltransferase [Caulobacter sp. S6]